MNDNKTKIEILDKISFKLGGIAKDTTEVQVVLTREDCLILQSLILERKKQLTTE